MLINEIRHIANSEPFYEIHWLITRRCSFSCSYCPPHRHNPKSFQADKESLIRAVERLETIVSNNKIRLNLTGGEPTIHPNFKDFINTALNTNKIKAVRIVTNLASNEKIYKYLADSSNTQTKKIYLVASFHWESASPERFLNNVRILADSNVELQVKIMLDINGEEKISKVIDGLKEINRNYKNIAIAVQRIRNTNNIEIDTTEFDEKHFVQVQSWGDLREVTFSTEEGNLLTQSNSNIDLVIKNKLNTFYKWKCYTGENTLFIDNDGSVFSALCKPDVGSIGNIFDDNIIEIPKFVSCPHKQCECGSTVRIPKIQPNENLHS
jgi:MoaA/NifB/PqqE/SkfB family radical SAM enzyme